MKLYSVFPVPFTDSVRPATLLYPVTSVHRSHECAPQPRVRTAARTTVTYTSGLGEVGAEHLRRCHKFEACWHRQTIWLWSCSHQAAFQMVHAVEHLRLNGCCDDGSRNCMHKSPGRPGGALCLVGYFTATLPVPIQTSGRRVSCHRSTRRHCTQLNSTSTQQCSPSEHAHACLLAAHGRLQQQQQVTLRQPSSQSMSHPNSPAPQNLSIPSFNRWLVELRKSTAAIMWSSDVASPRLLYRWLL